MTSNQKSLGAVLAVLASLVPACALAQPIHASAPKAELSVETFADLVARKDYRHAWRQMFKEHPQVPSWIARADGVSAPYSRVRIDGREYIVGSLCKPHDCMSNRFYGALASDKQHAWGVLVTAVENADASGEMVKYRWFGEPPAAIQAYLKGRSAREGEGE